MVKAMRRGRHSHAELRGYMVYSAGILIPLFVVLTYLFF